MNYQDDLTPKYQPQKFAKACRIMKTISIGLLVLMFLIVAYIAAKAFLFDPEAYQANINGAMKFNTDKFIMDIALTIVGLGLSSFFTWLFYSRLKSANAMHATKDDEIRKRLQEEFAAREQAAQKAVRRNR